MKNKNNWIFLEDNRQIVEEIKEKKWMIRTSRIEKRFKNTVYTCGNYRTGCRVKLRVDHFFNQEECVIFTANIHKNECLNIFTSNMQLRKEIIKLYDRRIFRFSEIIKCLGTLKDTYGNAAFPNLKIKSIYSFLYYYKNSKKNGTKNITTDDLESFCIDTVVEKKIRTPIKMTDRT